MRPLGLNRDAYRGETIDARAALGNLAEAARRHDWQQEVLTCDDGTVLETWTRVNGGEHRVYLSAGIHGDEPAGPLAVEQLVRENLWPAGLDLWLCPCLNPNGFPLNRRENAAGLDLNRQYLDREAAETRAHIAWLERQPAFDMALCLHEDWEARGF
jgi:protein MpaA